MNNVLKKLYDSYTYQDKSILKLEILIYLLLSLSFAYGFASQIYTYMIYGVINIIPTIIEGMLLILFVPQLVLMIEALKGYYPFNDKYDVKNSPKIRIVDKNNKDAFNTKQRNKSNSKITNFPGNKKQE